MKKMMLLAVMVALAAMMLAAAPAFADHKCPEPLPSENHDCVFEDHDNGEDDDGDDNVINDRDRILLRDVGNFEFAPVFDVSQETEQDCDTGEVSQPIDVTGGGDNSIQTVGLQPTAVTGCAQNAVGVLDFDPTLAAQGGDLAFNFDDTNVILDDDCDGEDDDGDGNRDEDEDCDGNDDNGNHDGRDFCDKDGDGNHDNDCDDNGDDNGDNVVDINDDDDFRFGGDRLIINGGGDDGGTELEDINASIDASPVLSVDGGGTINQTAIAESDTFVVKPWWLLHG